jgi:hypothetical protein
LLTAYYASPEDLANANKPEEKPDAKKGKGKKPAKDAPPAAK